MAARCVASPTACWTYSLCSSARTRFTKQKSESPRPLLQHEGRDDNGPAGRAATELTALGSRPKRESRPLTNGGESHMGESGEVLHGAFQVVFGGEALGLFVAGFGVADDADAGVRRENALHAAA